MPYLIDEDYDILVGSRVLKAQDQILRVRWHRKFIGTVFNFCVQTFLFKNIKDTQCGFKMFRKDAVKPIFSRGYLRGFGFDIEILYLAYKMGYKVKEVPISWISRTPDMGVSSFRLAKVGGGYWQVLWQLWLKTCCGFKRLYFDKNFNRFKDTVPKKNT